MLEQASIYDDSPAAVRRLLLVGYAVAGPAFAVLLAVEAPPRGRVAAVAAMLATSAAGALWLLSRRTPRPLDWILAGGLVPAACAWIGASATADEVPAIMVLVALIPWSAVLYDRRVVATILTLGTAACFAMSASLGGPVVGVRHAVTFAVLGASIGWVAQAKARRFRDARLRVLQSHLNDIEFVITPGGDIAAANDRAAEAFGYSRAELRAMNVAALVPPEQRDALRAGLDTAARRAVVAELEHVRRDGTRFAVEISSRPFQADGRTYIHGLLRDIEARRAAEREHRLLSTLVSRMAEAVITLDREDRIRTWSPGAERMYGWSAQEAVGRSPLGLIVPAAGAEQFRRALETARAEGEVRYDVRRRTKGGAEVVGSVVLVGLQDTVGAEDGVLAVVRDVTAQAAAEAALRESQAQLSSALAEVREEVSRREKLLAVVAHDLRSPLAAIALSADGLDGLAQGAEGLRRALAERGAIIGDAVQQMTRLVDDLVDVAAIQRGGLRLAWAMRDPRQVLDEALQQLRPVAARRGVELVRAASPEVPRIRCDGGRILQVLTNLLSNAARVTPAGGTISAAVEATPEAIRFTVRDTGPGLSEQIAARLFEPYRRGPDAQQKGAGLGLAIAKGIVDAHGGRIWADPAAGGGAVFHFTVPRGEGQEGMCSV